jgi:hypothetical protein
MRPAMCMCPAHSPSSTPGICKLTALRELELGGCWKRRYAVHVGVLTALLALRKLSLMSCTLTTGEEGRYVEWWAAMH